MAKQQKSAAKSAKSAAGPAKKAAQPAQGKEAAKPTAAAQVYHPLSEFRTQMDRLFDDFLGSWRMPPFGRMLDVAPSMQGMISVRTDVSETDNAIEVTAELPGLEEKDIEVTLHDGVLTIKGEKREEKEEKQKDYFFSERSYGSFHRSFRLPEIIDEQDISAQFDKGVLKVRIGKHAAAEKPEVKKIPIGK